MVRRAARSIRYWPEFPISTLPCMPNLMPAALWCQARGTMAVVGVKCARLVFWTARRKNLGVAFRSTRSRKTDQFTSTLPNGQGREEEKPNPPTARKPRAVGHPEVQSRPEPGAPGFTLRAWIPRAFWHVQPLLASHLENQPCICWLCQRVRTHRFLRAVGPQMPTTASHRSLSPAKN